MNKIVNKCLLAADKSMPELHLRQPGFALTLVDYFLNIVKGFKILKKQVI